MGETVIFMDASADLMASYAQEHDVHCVPMTCVSGGSSFVLSGFQTPDEIQAFYREMRQGKMVSTSQISPDEYVTAFRPFLEKGCDILYLALSSGLTGTCTQAAAAAEKLARKCPDGHLYIVDTLSATGGIGLLLEQAVALRDQGLPCSEIADRIREMAKTVCHVFVVEDLMHLSRGGRISAVSAVFGTALQIKPILIIDPEGKLTVVDKKRGTKAAIHELQARFENSRNPGEHRVFMCHADAKPLVQPLKDAILAADPQAEIISPLLSPVIGAHTGPGMISVIFFGDRSKLA